MCGARSISNSRLFSDFGTPEYIMNHLDMKPKFICARIRLPHTLKAILGNVFNVPTFILQSVTEVQV